MLDLEKALTSADLEILNEIITLAEEKAKHMYRHEQTCISLSEKEIFSEFKNAFKAYTKRCMDTPRYACVSCERLCYKKNVSQFNKFKVQMAESPFIKDLMAYIEKHDIQPEYICDYCQRKFRDGVLPGYSVLNNLFAHNVPDEIASLKQYEKMLIQRAKAFQTIVKMGTVINKKLPQRQMVQKAKGRTFHLPLPLQETLNKLCKSTDPINKNHEIILVRGVPTNSKIIWEDIELNNPEFVIQDIENDKESVLYDNHKLRPKIEMQETENNEAILNDKCQAMLTQIDESDDSYYDQYTIYPLYEKKSHKSDTVLYQMLKIQALPLDNREKDLDLLCFPDLYPFGTNGQHETRPVKLHDHEFIKCRLKSKHSQYRLNQQYLFYLLNNANMRQLSRGIYHKLNVTKLRDRYTVKEYLEALHKKLLESDLNTIFSTLRNTEQYWRRPRSDLECMIQHYGPATFFITLSPSEWLWDDLGEYIQVNGWSNDSSLSTSVLIARDPVSTSRFLDNKFQTMLDFICSKDHPIGEVIHYFWRREYQGRGVQHLHLLVWIKNAPILGKSPAEEVSKFILQHITCELPNKISSPTLYRRVNTHQRHIHNDYCLRSKKKGRKVYRVCRFDFPRPFTDMLILRDVVSSIAGRKQFKHKSRLYDLSRTEDEQNINDYNRIILTVWEGNMDIQFIGDNTRLLTYYVTKYVNKAAKCELSDTVLNSINNKNKSLASYLWNIALRLTNNRECGALEAADTLLGIPLYGTDRNTTIKWLDVSQIRYRKVKSYKEIQVLDGDSTDIFCPSVIDSHYPNRPEEFETMSLYEFVQWHDVTKIKPTSKKIVYHKMSNGYYLKRRQRECLINHYRYDVNTQPENYFFSLLLMFKPWRKIQDLKNGYDTYAESFHNNELYLEKALEYHEKSEESKNALEIAKQLLQQHLDDLEKQNTSQDDPDNPVGVQNIHAGDAMQDFKDLGDKQEIDISEMISRLNADQKRIFDRVTDTITSGKSVLRLYVSGEGGTGKSFLIKTIKCWLKQNLKKDTAVAAPTGIAAFNIDGLTVHRLLQLPVEHGHTPKYKPLANHVLKVLRADLKDFGQKHILLFGDLLQLPPVHEDSAFIQLTAENIRKYLGSLSATNLWTLTMMN
ncbi:PREDICTED: uncharacterized protein LOC108760158 [Trachymyrmex cornetzi]|uniref:uncharacterized protein LOC108760158 n=1 Tax=Trachymyrmex cornetzi TaxID=471704 RepID=UPI00084F2DFB|nr:PREDICTED: uncharacterized protein LOC108760158 [Trachymyrmex cornetzi]